ncbi:hypothetical protein [Microbacterium sp.]|uniref:hypothetical protein n=1 Tax=Microbacterium sp. TaxID=51671 RepID=UPI003A851608
MRTGIGRGTSAAVIRGAAAGLAVAALALAGCASGPPTASPRGEPPLGAYYLEAFSWQASYASDSSIVSVPESRLRARAEEASAIAEEAIVTCMADHGFRYIPEWPVPKSAGDGWRPDVRAWVAQHGYGLFASPYGPPEAEFLPNAEYVDSLPSAQQDAYYEALVGAPDGCRDVAYRDHPVATADLDDTEGEFGPLLIALEDFFYALPEAPEFDELNREWSQCMATVGHPGFTRQVDARAAMRDKIYPVLEEGQALPDPETPEGEALASEEIDLALADFDCREQTDYLPEAERIGAGLEQEFVEEHRAALEEYGSVVERQLDAVPTGG